MEEESFYKEYLFHIYAVHKSISIHIMSQDKKDRIAPANIIALVGLAGIGVISGIGALLNTEDGSLTWPIIWSVIIMIVLGGFLCLAIYAKGEDSHRELWTPVMWSSFVIYVIAAVFMCGPFLKFFFVVGDKEKLQKQANTEIANMESIFKNYEDQCEDFISNAETELRNFKVSGNYGTAELQEYYRTRVASGINDWKENTALPSTDISGIKMVDEWTSIKNEVNAWNYFKLPQLADRIKTLQERSWKELNNRIETFREDQGLIPVIKGGHGAPYYLDGYAEFDLGEAPVSNFASKLLQSENVITVLGVFAYLLLNLLVLFNLLVAPDSGIVDPRSKGPLGHPIR